MPDEQTVGYTLIETIVALLLFTIGALALVSTSAMIGQEMNTNAVRERAGRMAPSRFELVARACSGAVAGREVFVQVDPVWSLPFLDSTRLSVVETVSYPAL